MTAMELTREQRDRRVAVMRDVLKQLARRDVPMRASRGTYFYAALEPQDEPPTTGDLRDHADYFQARCDVCMKGMAFLSMARLYDGFPVINAVEDMELHVDNGTLEEHLEEIFDMATLDLMEAIFERDRDFSRFMVGADVALAAEEFGERYNDPAEAARAIAQNIIDHDGELLIPASPGRRAAGTGGNER